MAIWEGLLDIFEDALSALHGALEPLFGVHAWGWAIIAVTVIARLLLLPLGLKGARNMRAMQAVAPKVTELKKKYKVDRELLRKDPETYKARRAKLNEATMALYKEEGVNPAAGCLPLLAQAPIFFALYYVLRRMEPLANAEFYFFTDFINGGTAQGLGASVSQAGWPAWLLVALMVVAMFLSQRQTLAANVGGGEMAQQQKIIMYVMPAMLAVFSVSLPVAVMLYWATTNLWQWGQQALILREVSHELIDEPDDGKGPGKASRTAPPAKRPPSSRGANGRSNGKAGGTGKKRPTSSAKPAKREHLPRSGQR